jgi:hypothetical protein
MSNEIRAIGLPTSVTESINIGKVFFESGLFTDLKSAAQAVVKIQAGAEIGIPPFASLTGIHIIQGKPTLGAGVMAAKIKSSGKYDYRVKSHDEKICSIDFIQGKEVIGNSTFTIEDARKSGTKNLDKFPKNMLFARAISNGVKWYCPDVFSGPVYTPEDMDTEQKTEDVKAEVITTPKEEKNGEEAKVKIGQLYAKLEKCKTVPEVAQLYDANKNTVDANPELKKSFKETRDSLKPTVDNKTLLMEQSESTSTIPSPMRD